jgi:hypothetical protein
MEGISVPRIIIDTDDFGDINENDIHHARNAKPRNRAVDHRTEPRDRRQPRPSRRADGQESFKCGHCKAFIGPTVSGGRHRNHCPLCLYSRHVDDRRPGDRASTCRSLMAPVGTFHRPKGEQVIVHRCLGCGVERHNRVAADDNMLACLRLPPVAPRSGGRTTEEEGGEEEAIA